MSPETEVSAFHLAPAPVHAKDGSAQKPMGRSNARPITNSAYFGMENIAGNPPIRREV
jgi:hypothetical protein